LELSPVTGMKLKMQSRPHSRSSRRSFLLRTGVATATFQILPGHILGLNGAQSANERVNIAGIGLGGQGTGDISQFKDHNIVALCDVDSATAAGAFKRFPNAKRYTDYREMLDKQKDIDAVVVATPDHQHAFATMRAINAGKHVYCEKPLTHSVWEARQIAEAARKKKVATQMGNQGQASEGTRRLQELILDNAVGPVTEVHIWTDRPSNGLFNEYWPQGIPRPKETPAVPSTLDWDLWLGPAPERPYNPAYTPFKWRGWWDFGTGALGDIGCHSFDPIFRALKLGAPLSVEASSSRVNEETYPIASMVIYRFAARGEMPPVELRWYDGGLRPPRPDELGSDQAMPTTGAYLVGKKGKIIGERSTYRLLPDSLQKDYGDPPRKLARSPGHYQEWIDACKGGSVAGSNFDWAGPLTETVLLGNVALRLKMREEVTKKKLLWDPLNLRFTNSETANQFLRREYRRGWDLV
jgi:predicted dehydrogenase